MYKFIEKNQELLLVIVFLMFVGYSSLVGWGVI